MDLWMTLSPLLDTVYSPASSRRLPLIGRLAASSPDYRAMAVLPEFMMLGRRPGAPVICG